MTPGELTKISKQVADLLGRDSNSELSAEELAQEVTEKIVSAYEEIQAKAYNLVVVASFCLEDGSVYTAAVGPLSTRAQQRARAVGERFAWDYKTRKGTGKFTLVPLVRDPSQAWDEARRELLEEYHGVLQSVTPGVEASYEPMRFEMSTKIRNRIQADWQVDPEILLRKFGPHCLCGRYTFPEKTNLGDPVTLGCPLHQEEGSDGTA